MALKSFSILRVSPSIRSNVTDSSYRSFRHKRIVLSIYLCVLHEITAILMNFEMMIHGKINLSAIIKASLYLKTLGSAG